MADKIDDPAGQQTSETDPAGQGTPGEKPGGNADSANGAAEQKDSPDLALVMKEIEGLKAENRTLKEKSITDNESIAAIEANKNKILEEKRQTLAANGEHKALAESLKSENDTLNEKIKSLSELETSGAAKDTQIEALTKILEDNVNSALNSLSDIDKKQITDSPGWAAKNSSEKLAFINYQIPFFGSKSKGAAGGERGGTGPADKIETGLATRGKSGTRTVIEQIAADIAAGR